MGSRPRPSYPVLSATSQGFPITSAPTADITRNPESSKWNERPEPSIGKEPIRGMKTALLFPGQGSRLFTHSPSCSSSVSLCSGPFGVTRFIELGPGKVLKGLCRRIDSAIRCQVAETPDGVRVLA